MGEDPAHGGGQIGLLRQQFGGPRRFDVGADPAAPGQGTMDAEKAHAGGVLRSGGADQPRSTGVR